MQTEQDIRARRHQYENDLEGWSEPNGYLVPTEPDIAARAIIRIELRVAIDTLTSVLGDRPLDARASETATHRDRMRIADDAVAQAVAA